MTTATAAIPVFGVRHLSPGAAWHLRRFLDDTKPSIVLIEGIADATEMIPDILHRQTVPPLAILAFTQGAPVQTIVSPLARYSPEYQAIAWCKTHRVASRFIDLPSGAFLAAERTRMEAVKRAAEERLAKLAEDEEAFQAELDTRRAAGEEPDPAREPDDTPPESYAPERMLDALDATQPSLYERIAQHAGEPDYETYWERRFEHNRATDAYRQGALAFGAALRGHADHDEAWTAENNTREAFMRRQIRQAIDDGHEPDRIVVVVGAYHAPVMTLDHHAMTDEEFEALPTEPSHKTLMPYSDFKLSAQSGYGAGNHAPAYFARLWDGLQAGEIEHVARQYLTEIATRMRESGTFRSTAEVIDGVRLANTLAAMRDGQAPTLYELQDAAVTLLGRGEPSAIADARARVEVGTAVGRLPKGVSQTSIQDDFARSLETLKLEEFRTPVARDLRLDLRENRRVSSEAAAYRDLHRSVFLHRLAALNIGFGTHTPREQDRATWAEHWQMVWTPEHEIALVESVLLGETVELACAFALRRALDECTSVARAAALVRRAGECRILDVMGDARTVLQGLAAESTDLTQLAGAGAELGALVRYGDVRKIDGEPLKPLIRQFTIEGSLALDQAATCDNKAANELLPALSEFERLTLEFDDITDGPLWVRALHDLASRDDRNPLLSGYAMALLLERGETTDDDLVREVSRRLSPGIEADLGAGWFEGIAQRNRYALLSRLSLWRALAEYVDELEQDEFLRALVFLRRALAGFSPQERRQITDILAEHWGVDRDTLTETIETGLSDDESQAIDDLADFEFDDL